jgi:hypothetical protein
MKLAGRLCIWIGGSLAFVSLFLHYAEGESRFDFATRGPLIFLLLILVIVAGSVVTLFLELPVLVVIATGAALYLFASLFPIEYTNYRFLQVGFWLGAVGSLAMAIGGSLCLASIWPRSGWARVTGLGAEFGGSPHSLAQSRPTAPLPHATPAAGWYPDPSSPGRQRYWSGVAWTEDVRP